MSVRTTDERASQDRRLRLKTQDQQLIGRVIEGTGLNRWEAEVLVNVVRDVYFAQPEDAVLRSGQVRYECVDAAEGPGKPIEACRLRTVVLTLFDPDDRGPETPQTCGGLRQRRILRMTEEARDQGGLLSQEDLASLLCCTVRTIRRDVRYIREHNRILVPTRGQLRDIGPSVSHKGVIVRWWLRGEEALAIARRVNHSLESVERYIQHFARVVFLLWRRLHPLEIALAIGISSRNVKTYLDLYDKYKRCGPYRSRMQEIEVIAKPHYTAEDEKKGPGPSRPSSGGGRPA
jgi:hypothetical protein